MPRGGHLLFGVSAQAIYLRSYEGGLTTIFSTASDVHAEGLLLERRSTSLPPGVGASRLPECKQPGRVHKSQDSDDGKQELAF